jgi:hypothetical protein
MCCIHINKRNSVAFSPQANCKEREPLGRYKNREELMHEEFREHSKHEESSVSTVSTKTIPDLYIYFLVFMT